MARKSRVILWKHKNGCFYLRYTFRGERRFFSTRTRDPGKAELIRRKEEEYLLQGLDPELERERKRLESMSRNITLAELWPDIQRRHLRDKSPNTRSIYQANLDNLSKCKLNDKPLTEIPLQCFNRKIVNIYRDLRLDKGVKPSTVNRDIQFLHCALNLAVKWELIESNPIQGIDKIAEKNRRDVSNLNSTDLAPLMESLPSPVDEISRFIYYSWRRLSEVLNLRIEHVRKIDLPKPHYTARYHTKGGKWQEFPLSSMVLEIFRRNAGSRTEGPVFLNRETKEGYRYIHKTFDRHVRKKEINLRIADGRYLNRHDLRRLAATDAARRGYSQAEIGEALGHSQKTVTGRYSPNRLVPVEIFESQTRIEKKTVQGKRKKKAKK